MERPSLRFVSLSDRSDTPIKEKPPASGKIEGASNVAVPSLIKVLLVFRTQHDKERNNI